MRTTHVSEYVIRSGVAQLEGKLTAEAGQGDNECPMQVNFAVLADYAIVDRTNKLSVLGIFDQFNVSSFPFTIPQMFLVVSIAGEPSEAGRQFQLETLFWDPDGAQLFAHEAPFMFQPSDPPGVRSVYNAIIGLHGLVLRAAGNYSFIVRVNGEERARATVRAIQVQQGAQT